MKISNIFRTNLLILLIILLNNIISQAQCVLSCSPDDVLVTLGASCSLTVTADVVGVGTDLSCPGTKTIEILNLDNTPLDGSPNLNQSHLGKRFIVKIKHLATNNECYGSIKVVDKLPPVIVCKDITIGCDEPTDTAYLRQKYVDAPPIVSDNCGSKIKLTYTETKLPNIACSLGANVGAVLGRAWTATDQFGNTAIAAQRIIIGKADIANVVFPKNRDGIELPVIDCTKSNTNPDSTGRPTYKGANISIYCNLGLTYKDEQQYVCGGNIKIIRNWTVLDLCTGLFRSQYQIIKVQDTTGPLISCPKDMTVKADGNSCTASVSMPTPTISGACGTINYNYFIKTSIGTVNGNLINNLPVGKNIVQYVVSDGCGKTNSCTMTVTVKDTIAPIVVPKLNYKITARFDIPHPIYADSLNLGSHDNCGIDSFSVAFANQSPKIFSKKINISCEHIGNNTVVTLRVYDHSGNFSDVDIPLIVEDLSIPTINCPPSITINCGEDYKDLLKTGKATAENNCQYNISFKDVEDLTTCKTGVVHRTWTLIDKGGRSVSCVQDIFITIKNNIYINIANPQDTTDDATFPTDIELKGCNADISPSNIGFPTVVTKDCSRIVVSYEDFLQPVITPYCKIIDRKWTIIDWCQYNFTNPTSVGKWVYHQNIKILAGPPQAAAVSGTIMTETNTGVENVSLKVSNMNPALTNTTGNFKISDLLLGNTYSIEPEKLTQPMNGVTTYDLVLIYKHILGTEQLTSPYKIIAADINKSGAVTAADIVELRRMILKINENFSNNKSWRFVSSNYVFKDASNALAEPFPEKFEVSNTKSEQVANFVAIKIGDINGNAATNSTALLGMEQRNNKQIFSIISDEQELQVGKTYKILLSTNEQLENIDGGQFTLEINKNDAEFVDIQEVNKCFNKENFGFSYLEEGQITASFNTPTNEKRLFELTLKAKSNAWLSDVLSINSGRIVAEAYNKAGEIMDIKLNINAENKEKENSNAFKLYQNQPNPFSASTNIKFSMPEKTKAVFSIFDISGKLILQQEYQTNVGLNEFEIDKSVFNGATGIFYYKIASEKFVDTKKMILE